MVLLFLPMIQQYTQYFTETSLQGAFVPPPKPEYTFEKVQSFQYQKEIEDYLNYNFGFRPFFVKLKNTWEYLFFKQINVADQIEGKNGYIYSLGSTERTFGHYYNGQENNANTVFKINLLRNEIEKNGGTLFVVIAPSKESIYPEYLPEKYQNTNTVLSDYHDFISEYNKWNIPYLDLYMQFKNYKLNTSIPLFTKTGFHWSTYATTFVQDSICRKLERQLSITLPKFEQVGVEISDTAREADDDFEEPMNLLFSLNSGKYIYPIFKLLPSKKETKKPKVIIIGDSFFWQVKNLRVLKSLLSEESRFWYYFSKSFPLGDIAGGELNKQDAMKELLDADAVILLGSMGTFDNFPYGVSDYMYSNLYDESSIKSIKEKLRGDYLTHNKDNKDKKEKQKTEIELTIEAHQLYGNREVVKLRANNNMFVCADAANQKIVSADKPIASLWETFSIINFKDGTSAILSFENKFLSAEIDTDKKLIANRDNLWDWETFIVEKQKNNTVALKASNGKYVSVDRKTNQLFATSDAVGENEVFEIIPF